MALIGMRKQVRKVHWATPFFRGRPSWTLFIVCLAGSVFVAVSSFRSMAEQNGRGGGGFIVAIILAIAGANQWRRLMTMRKDRLTAKSIKQR